MSLFRPERRTYGDSLADLLDQRGRRTAAGQPVDDEHAMRLAAVWACVDLISELVSTLPVDEFKRGPNGERIPFQSRPRLLEDPAGDNTGFEVWSRQVMTSLLLRGNNYGLVLQLEEGWPSQIESIHPDRVTWHRESNQGEAETRLDGKKVVRWPAGPLWHLPAYSVPGYPVGMSPIKYAAETIGLGLATQQFGSQWFGDGAHPTGMIKSDAEITQAQALVLKKRVMDAMRGNREPLALGSGITYDRIQVSPDESQFLETVKANADDVAKFFFRRPPGEGGQVTYANVEARSLDLLTYTLNGWLVRLERALSRLRPRPRFVKFNADALVRVDLLTRYKAHDTAIRDGWKSRNDVRRLEDEPPIPDGDEYLWPPYAVTLPTEGGDNVGLTQPAGPG